MQGGISIRGPLIPPIYISNNTKPFECHPNGENHGTLLLTLASIGVAANAFLGALILTRKSFRRWSSGLLLHGTFVDGARAALLIPLALSVLRCHPVGRCSLVDTAFLLLATVTSLNLLMASLSDAPLLPPPVLVPTLLSLQDYYEEDVLASHRTEGEFDETKAMPDSPQCVLFGIFMVWFAALTINLGPTFLSGALAAQAAATPRTTSCPLVRGPARHIILNILWATINLLCVGLAAAHLRKLKKDLARARLGVLAAAGVGLASLAGIQPHQALGPGSSVTASSPAQHHHGSRHALNSQSSTQNHYQMNKHHQQSHLVTNNANTAEMDAFLRRAQRHGRSHIRTLGTLAVANLLCWVPLYICALVAPVGTGAWEDPAPYAYEITLTLAFAHSGAHPLLLLFLHQPLRHGLKLCLAECCCFLCNFFGMDFDIPSDDNSPQHSRVELRSHVDSGRRSHPGSHHGSQIRLHSSESLISLKRSSSVKSDRDASSPPLLDEDLMLPPAPPPPCSSSSAATSSAFRKQVAVKYQPIPNNSHHLSPSHTNMNH